MRWVLALVLMVHVARASPAGDVTKAFQSFVETAGTAEPKLEVFIPPQGDSPEDNAWPVMPKDRAIDTLLMARQKFPGSPATLDALCKRFGVDNSNRTLHGALLDAQLLAEVYLELLGGRQTGLSFAGGPTSKSGPTGPVRIDRAFREARVFAVSDEEAAAHAEMLKKIKNPLWAVE